MSPAFQVDSFIIESPGKPKVLHTTTTTKSLQSRPALCDPIDSSPPSSPVPGILKARTLEWVSEVLLINIYLVVRT